jgi:glycosyltransferase involved in cell wall biosynthesis
MKPGLCFVVSVPMTAVAFLNGHIDYLSSDYEITVVCNFDGTEKDILKNAQLKNIRIARKISPFSDLKAVYSLARFLKKGDFQIVHSVTPKAGLITALAGWLAKTPIRIHWFTGQVWVLKSGIQRWVLKNLDRLVAKLNTSVLVDSPTQRDFLIEQRVINPTKAQVLGSGSISGVDTERFRPNPEMRVATRAELGIEDPNAPIILFLGRLNHDKGIETLLQAFSRQTIESDSFLLLVGPDEGNYIPRIPELLGERREYFRYIPFTVESEKYMAGSDIFCLPSLREGFGLSVIEASACELPVIATNIYGVQDAVRDGETGVLIDATSATQLASTIKVLADNPTGRASMGLAGRIYAQRCFESTEVQRLLRDYYSELLIGT